LVLHLNALSGDGVRPYRWLIPGLAALVGVALLEWTSVASGFDSDHPRPSHVAHELNADTGSARFISPDAELDSWSSQFFPADPVKADYELQPGIETSAFSAVTTAVALQPATVEVVADTIADGVRTVTLRISSPRAAPDLQVEILTGERSWWRRWTAACWVWRTTLRRKRAS
jgi:hypothetical protein